MLPQASDLDLWGFQLVRAVSLPVSSVWKLRGALLSCRQLDEQLQVRAGISQPGLLCAFSLGCPVSPCISYHTEKGARGSSAFLAGRFELSLKKAVASEEAVASKW